jgi:hypothetical protein
LFLGDQSDNIADKLRKGRQPRGAEHHAHLHPEKMRRGSTHGQAKLTEADVTEMRRRYVNGETVASISKDYPVWYMQVKNAVKRITWRHVP